MIVYETELLQWPCYTDESSWAEKRYGWRFDETAAI